MYAGIEPVKRVSPVLQALSRAQVGLWVCETSCAMYQAALCELKMEEVSRERSDKLDQTQRKLDQFYENMDLMRQNQYIVSEEEEIGGKGEEDK